ncbi:Alpha/Beta hydrolase protein [Podospora didyma]|uniref:Alpha/Beta hydrolase protein n=1 Tax=Podospora didyma TaxID=330526 RepID=A0AAE0P4C5_9PEZI|nr:Alpha/Beta hydrolase protein [Podospora didyma]
MASPAHWTFTPLVSAFPTTVFPNIALWNASNAVKNLTYQIEVSWPFEWESREVANKTALAMYVIDGNALGMTASEAFKRRGAVEPTQPDGIVVSIGYPLTDAVYSFTRRDVDFRPPLPAPQTPPSGADDFIEFIDGAVRPWVRSNLFPSVSFTRHALFGHSLGGLFVTYALIAQPDLFDTFLIASPAIFWNNGSILAEVSRRLGTGLERRQSLSPRLNPRANRPGCQSNGTLLSKPAVVISYGSLESQALRRRTETEAAYQARKTRLEQFQFKMLGNYCYELFDRLKGSGKTRDVMLKLYPGEDHSSVAASAINDGIDYFVDW